MARHPVVLQKSLESLRPFTAKFHDLIEAWRVEVDYLTLPALEQLLAAIEETLALEPKRAGTLNPVATLLAPMARRARIEAEIAEAIPATIPFRRAQ
jgi:hypothetical protein